MEPTHEPPLSPGAASRVAGGSVVVGGRVVATDATGVTLADAFGSVGAELAGSHGLEPGDHALVSGRMSAGRLVEAALVARYPKPCPAARETERARFADAGVAERLALRAAVIGAVRGFFAERGYLEVDTPALVPCPGLDLHLDGFSIEAGAGGRPAYLATSPEYQMKRLLAGGLPRIFQLGHAYRRGEVGGRHNPEFAILEWYRAFAGIEELMTETEELVRTVVARHVDGAKVRVERQRVDVAQPFARVSVADAFARHADCPRAHMLALAAEDEERFFRLLVEKVEPALGRYGVPVLLHDYPASQASLARRRPDDPAVCERFELYLGELELCNGFGELTCPIEQRARLEAERERRAERGLPCYPLDERFLAALEQGMPPAAGNALGVDRLVAVIAGVDAIAEVMAFPFGWL